MIIEFTERTIRQADGQPFRFEPWQKEKIIEPVFYDLDSEGNRKINLALVGMPKKNGKSTIASLIAAYGLLGDSEPEPEIYGVAGDKDQAKIIFNQTRKAFERSPILLNEVTIYKDAIERKDGTGFYKVLSADSPTAHGLNPHFVIWDELWNQTTYSLWEALTHSPVRKQALHFITTYAGFGQSEGDLLFDLFKRGEKGNDPRMYMFWTNKNWASWITPEYLSQQKSRLPGHIYLRLHENRWTSGQGSFLDASDVDNSVNSLLRPQFSGQRGISYFMGVDIGLKHDRSVVTVCHKESATDEIIVDDVNSWKGNLLKSVQIEDVENHIIEKCKQFNIKKVLVDPWQAQGMIQRLQNRKPRIPIEEFCFTGTNITNLTKNLFYLFKQGKIQIYKHAEMIKELKAVIAKETNYGWRIDHAGRSKRDDFVISLGIAALAAVQESGKYELDEINCTNPNLTDQCYLIRGHFVCGCPNCIADLKVKQMHAEFSKHNENKQIRIPEFFNQHVQVTGATIFKIL